MVDLRRLGNLLHGERVDGAGHVDEEKEMPLSLNASPSSLVCCVCVEVSCVCSKTLKSLLSEEVPCKLLRFALGDPKLEASRFITPSLLFSGLDFAGELLSCIGAWRNLSVCVFLNSARGASSGFISAEALGVTSPLLRFSWSPSMESRVDGMVETLMLVWLGLSLRARLRGLLGDVLRTEARDALVRLMEYLGLVTGSPVLSVVNGRERPDGLVALGEVWPEYVV